VGAAPRPVWVRGEITLGQLLKLAGVVETGGHAKELILDGMVTVNGQEERRRGRKLAPADVVRVGTATLVVERRPAEAGGQSPSPR
jgi:ribosome-associated protein